MAAGRASREWAAGLTAVTSPIQTLADRGPCRRDGIREARGFALNGTHYDSTERQIRFEITEAALALLGNIGFDPVYGARPLKRAIQAQLENRVG